MSVVIIVVILVVAVVWHVCSLGVVRIVVIIVVVSSKMLAKKCEIFQQICTSIFHIFMALESKTAHQCHAPNTHGTHTPALMAEYKRGGGKEEEERKPFAFNYFISLLFKNKN